jgi:hypothetical protein
MDTASRRPDKGPQLERNVGRALALYFAFFAGFLPAEVVASMAGDQFANMILIALLGGAGFALWQWGRQVAWVIASLALLTIPFVPIFSLVMGGADIVKATIVVTVGLALPGLVAAGLILDSERSLHVARGANSATT